MCCGLTWAREALRSYVPICRFGITPSGEAEAQHPSLLTSSACPNTTREVTRENFRTCPPSVLQHQHPCLNRSCVYVMGLLRGQSLLELSSQGGWWDHQSPRPLPISSLLVLAPSPLGLGNSRERKESDRRANHSPQPRQITAVKEKRHHQF